MIKIFSYFGGVGGVCAGAQDAGLEVVGTVEIDPAIAAIHKANFPYADCRVANVLDIDPITLPDFDFFWSSNPCPNFSTAKQNGGETELDIALAQSVANVIQYKRPRCFALENVRGYAKSKSLGIITDELDRQGYSFNVLILDAVNYGVPQNRIRLILRATLNSELRDLPLTHTALINWQGWYAAIADILPTCKRTYITEGQLKALSKGCWGDWENVQSPLLLERVGYGKRSPTIRTENQPCITIRASSGCDGKGAFRSPLTALLPNGEVFALDDRCLSRLSTFPTWFKWGKLKGINCKGIGNACPSLLAQRIVESLIS
jgi:DNA (cytosine-5)-methyltransferase 1